MEHNNTIDLKTIEYYIRTEYNRMDECKIKIHTNTIWFNAMLTSHNTRCEL